MTQSPVKITCQDHHLGGGIFLSLAKCCQVIDFDTLESWSPAGSTAKARRAASREAKRGLSGTHQVTLRTWLAPINTFHRKPMRASAPKLFSRSTKHDTNALFAQVFTSLGHFCMWGDSVQTTDRTEALVLFVFYSEIQRALSKCSCFLMPLRISCPFRKVPVSRRHV